MVKWSTTRDKKGNWTLVDVPDVEFDNSKEPSVTDKSHYRPNAPSYARVDGSGRVGLFDFPDGEDTGIDLSYLRKRGIDQTEIDAYTERLKNLSKEQLDQLKYEAAQEIIEKSKKLEKENQDKINQLNSSASNSSTSQ